MRRLYNLGESKRHHAPMVYVYHFALFALVEKVIMGSD